jgi:hypothetical protein
LNPARYAAGATNPLLQALQAGLQAKQTGESMKKSTLILNRAFQEAEDGFCQLSPVGEFPGAVENQDGEMIPVIQVLAMEHLESIFNRLQELAKDEEWSGILGDREHWSLTDDRETDALTWFKEFGLRPDGLYGKGRKTTLGEQLIGGGVLRKVSPVFDVVAEDGGEIKAGSRVVPTALDSIGFTNRPRLGRFMKPVTNRGDGHQQKQPTTGGNMKLVNKALGLQDDAAEASVVAAIEKLQNRAAEADGLQTELDAEKQKVATLENKQLEAEADEFVEANKDRILNSDEARGEMRKLYIENKDAAERAIKLFPTKQEAPKVPNKVPRQPDDPTGDSAETKRAVQIGNRARKIQTDAKNRGETVPWPSAWAQAKSEVAAE